jgi:hypothetical protein
MGLDEPGLQRCSGGVESPGVTFEFVEDGLNKLESTSFRRDEHALDFRSVVGDQPGRAASNRHAIESCDQKHTSAIGDLFGVEAEEIVADIRATVQLGIEPINEIEGDGVVEVSWVDGQFGQRRADVERIWSRAVFGEKRGAPFGIVDGGICPALTHHAATARSVV